MFKTDQSQEAELPVALFSSLGSAITGAAHGDVTVKFKKQGDSTFTTKSVDASNWREAGSGIYYITFTAGNLDTLGDFTYWVAHTSGYHISVVEITDWATEAQTLTDLYDLMATKVNKSAIIEREKALDNQMQYIAQQYESLYDDMIQLAMEIAALKKRIADLP